jgi:glyoxylase-like metal-dependent hydrolase (beta-lactamase superfamily II)
MTGTQSIHDIILTHGHGDHQGGVLTLLHEFKQRNIPLPKIHKRDIVNGQFPSIGFETSHIEDNQIFTTEGATLHAIYTPGHTDDHIALVVEVCNMLFLCLCLLYI